MFGLAPRKIIVYANFPRAGSDKVINDMRADEARPAGYQKGFTLYVH